MTKDNEVIAEKTDPEQWRHQALVAFSDRQSSRMKHRSTILFILSI